MNKKIANIVIVICLIIQIADLYPSIENKFDYKEKTYDISEVEWENVLEKTEHIVFLNLNEDSFDRMRSAHYKMAYLAYKYNCTLNNFYFAREIENTTKTSYNYIDCLKRGEIEDNYIYVLNQMNDYVWWNSNLNSCMIDGFIVITPNV